MVTVDGTKIILFFSFIIFAVVIFVAWDIYRKRRIFAFARELNGYKFYPIIGSAYHLIGENVFSALRKTIKVYSLPCNTWIGHNYHYLTANAEEVKIILNHSNTLDKNSAYKTFPVLFGNTLLIAEVDIWKKNRKMFAKSFSQSILNTFLEVFFKKSCILVDILRKSDSRDMFDIFERFSLDNFCATFIRLDLDAQINMEDEVTDIVRRMHIIFSKRMLSSNYLPERLWLFTPEGRKFLKDCNRLKAVIDRIIQKKREMFLEKNDFRNYLDKLPLMEMMLETEGTAFVEAKIFQEIFLFMIAATDTTGITLAFTFTLLGMNPEAQDKVYQEVIQTVGTDGPIHHNDLPNLKYTERAIFESMRLLPAAPVLGRHATADVDLGTRKIPSGANILISVFNLHRSEKYWTNPLEYNPDRFLPEEVAKRHPSAFIPFSAGPRNCLGKRYAIMKMKVAVAHVIRNYKIRSGYKSVEDMELESYITMKTVHALDCKFIPRCY